MSRETSTKLKVLRLGLNVNQIEDVNPFNKMKNIEVKLSIDASLKPVQQPLQRIPIALVGKLAAKLEEAVRLDIIEPVRGPSSWISPVGIIFKGNNEIKLCIDMRRGNEAILRESYSLPTFDTFMPKLRGEMFLLELHEITREITTFITYKGLFRYKRLMFGVNAAPEIFQRTLEGLLAPCNNCLNYIDDVNVFGCTEKEHNGAVKL